MYVLYITVRIFLIIIGLKRSTFHKPSLARMRRSVELSMFALVTSGSERRWDFRFLSPKARETASWPFTRATSPVTEKMLIVQQQLQSRESQKKMKNITMNYKITVHQEHNPKILSKNHMYQKKVLQHLACLRRSRLYLQYSHALCWARGQYSSVLPVPSLTRQLVNLPHWQSITHQHL